jgi:hypothetical protein
MALGNIRAENVEQLTLKSGVSMTFEAGAQRRRRAART